MRARTNHIYVKFKPGFNGGYPQTFIIEYRKASAAHWTRCEVYNSDTHYNIENLEFGTKYQIRIYSFNKLGNSTVIDGYDIQTKGILHLCVKIACNILFFISFSCLIKNTVNE